MDSSKLKVPIGARRMFAFLNVSLMGLLFAFFFATSPVALAESGLNALYFVDSIQLEGSTSQPSEAVNAIASSSTGPQVTQDPTRAALENHGYNVTQVDNYSSFESAIDSGSWDIVVLMNQGDWVGDIPNFLAYVADGGRAIMADWSGDGTLGSAFGVSYTGNDNQQPVTITDADLGAGLTNPLPLVNPGWITFSMGMSTTETVLATFPNGDAAVVLGNESRTAAVGFLNDTIHTDADAILFYENLIGLVAGPPPPPPVLRIDPTEMPPVTLRQDEAPITQILTLHNDGEGPLRFKFRTEDTTTTSGISETNPIPYMEIGKDEVDPRQGPPVTQGRGGPDAFGYSWIDSDETGGPTFDWIDISDTGTLISGLYDDNYVGPFPIGFNFDFYGNAHTEFYVQSNGVINFDNRYISGSNQPIPMADDYNNLIAWMWDDLYHNSDSSVYYEVVDDNKLVIQFQNYDEYGGDGRVDAQVILYRNGSIQIQYLEFRNGMDLNESTIGIENLNGTAGLQVAFNASYLHNELAILFTPGASWLTPDPISGSVPAGGSQEITLIYDASEQASGDYDADIIITSNDPENPEVTVPATLHVDPRLPGVMVPSPSSIEETLREGESSVHTLTLSNTGEGYLTYNLSLTQTSTAPTEYPILTEIPDGVGFRSDELIIKIAEGADRAEVALLRESINATLKKTIEQLDIEVWNIPATDEPGLVDLIQELSANRNIGYAEPNYIQKAIGIPNDARFDELWGMHNTGQTGGTADADIDAVEAWDTFTGSRDVVVAVIDTGVDYNHVDLVDNRWVNEGEIPSNGIDDDGNGYIDDVYGYDFAYGDSDPMDGHSHGTHCSGTIGGVGNNSIGVAGVSHAVRIMAVKFLDDWGSGYTDDAIDSIIYAVDNGAQILSNSWGGGGFSQGLEDAISYANDHNVLFVAAAGNEYSNNDVYPNYPSNYEVPNVLAVAATDHDDDKPSWSNYGLTTVDLGAPGVDILSTVPGDGYDHFSGTSMATPHVSGAAALIKGYNPNLSALELKSILMESVDLVDSMDGITVTGGRLNINNALKMSGTPWITLEGELSGEIAPGGSVELTVRLNAPEYLLGDYTADINIDSNDPVNPHQVVPVVLHVIMGTRYSLSVAKSGTGDGTVTSSPAGIDCGSDCMEDFVADTEVLLTATPASGSTFGSWTNCPTPTDNECTVVMDQARQVTATFDLIPPPVLRVEPTEMPPVTLAPDETTTQTLTLHNDGEGVLRATLSIDAHSSGGNPQLIPGEPQSDSSMKADRNAGSENAKEVGELNPVFTPLAENLEVLYVNTMAGWDSSFRSGLQGLPNIGTLDILDGETSTPNVDYLLQYDVVVLASNYYFADSSTLGNNLADYVDAGGRVILLAGTFDADEGWALDGRIMTAAYSPLAPEYYSEAWADAVSFENHPITQGVSSLSTYYYNHSVAPQGNGQPLGLYDTGYLIGAYNPDKPIVAINVFPVDGNWSGDLIRLVGNALDWVAGSRWLSVAPRTVEVPPHESIQVEVTYNATDEGDYAADIVIASNDPVNPEVTVAATLRVGGPIEFNCKNVTDISKKECQALVALYDSTDGANWRDNTGWKVTNTPCNWYGVTCKNGSVEKLELYSNNLNGSISKKFFKLKKLEILDLSYNEIDASILKNVKKLKNLETLWLNNCKLSGKIPNSLMKLKKLTDLDLYDNCLNSRVSNKLGKWLDKLNPGWDEAQTNCLY
jgi:subtilisin family serine protease